MITSGLIWLTFQEIVMERQSHFNLWTIELVNCDARTIIHFIQKLLNKKLSQVLKTQKDYETRLSENIKLQARTSVIMQISVINRSLEMLVVHKGECQENASCSQKNIRRLIAYIVTFSFSMHLFLSLQTILLDPSGQGSSWLITRDVQLNRNIKKKVILTTLSCRELSVSVASHHCWHWLTLLGLQGLHQRRASDMRFTTPCLRLDLTRLGGYPL